MAVKTITVTTDAYEALKSLKEKNESFSETILRVYGKKSLLEFAGALSESSACKIENHIREKRKLHREMRNKRMKRLIGELEGKHGSS